jgi:hypothetical protein
MPEKYKHKTNRGSMFENDHKVEGDKRPDFTGSVDVNGTIFWISGWKEMTSQGKKKLSLSVKEQEERAPEAPATRGNFPKRNTSSW